MPAYGKKICSFLLLFLALSLHRAFSQSLHVQDGVLYIDFQTTESEEEKVKSAFGNSSTVNFERGGRSFLRLDGLMGRNCELSALIVELITHFHTDHVTYSVVERCLREGSFSRILAPYPFRESSRERVFAMLLEREGAGGDKTENPVLDIAPADKSEDRDVSVRIGNFYYSLFTVGSDITVEVFKYYQPRDLNNDGLFFRITHKTVSYFLFGDFDDPGGIEELLDLSLTMNLKADVVKWPHHAHRFPDNERTDAIIQRMNAEIGPRFIIWERHFTQSAERFREYIERFDFSDKFLCSDDREIIIISLIEKMFLIV